MSENLCYMIVAIVSLTAIALSMAHVMPL
ncbi:hypothetical protein PUN4_180092 [Paraburkholderia unamae]|nr:hypothetical protein PUN4_180092 [Paraburkholderia unamae]